MNTSLEMFAMMFEALSDRASGMPDGVQLGLKICLTYEDGSEVPGSNSGYGAMPGELVLGLEDVEQALRLAALLSWVAKS